MNKLTDTKRIVDNKAIFFVFLLIIAFTAYFFHFRKFGFYEDDYWLAGIPANANFRELLDFIKSGLVNFERNQGRYAATILPFLLTFVVFKAGGMYFLYIFGMLLVTLNAYLVYIIIRKGFPEFIAFTAAIIYLLYPSDTTKGLLVHIYHLQFSVVFTLTGMILYLNNRKIAGFFLAFVSLLFYESAFLPFIFVPFLAYLEWDKKMWLRVIYHWVIIGILFLALFIFRKSLGEKVVNELQLFDLVKKTLLSLVKGPVIAMWAFIKAPADTLIKLRTTLPYFLVAAVFTVTFVLLRSAGIKFSDKWVGGLKGEGKLLKGEINMNEEFSYVLKAFIVGILILVAGYVFAITHYPPVDLKGRGTSVHLGGTFGGALAVSAVIYFIFFIISPGFWRKAFIVFIGLYIALLTAYGSIIQKDYMVSWDYQKKFWKKIVEVCPDLGDRTVIFVNDKNESQTQYIISDSWACPIILDNLFKFPADWERSPKLQVIKDSIAAKLYTEDSVLAYEPRFPFLFDVDKKVALENGKVIFLEYSGNTMSRQFKDTVIHGITLELQKPDTLVYPVFERTNLYPYMFPGDN
jgi:hypothetical protein